MTFLASQVLTTVVLGLALVAGIAHAQTSFNASGGGGLIPGYDGRTCDASIEGAMRSVRTFSGPQIGLVGHWKLDETSGAQIFDSSSAVNHGSIPVDASTLTASDSNGNYLNFDGVSYVTIPHSNTYDIQDVHPITVTFWMKIDPGGGYGSAFAKRAGGPGYYGLMHTAPGMRFAMRTTDGAGTNFNPFKPGIDTGEWVHVSCVFDHPNLTKRCYWNGTQFDGTRSLHAASHENVAPLTLMGGATGAMRDFRIYDRVLNVSEIAQVMQFSTWTQVCTDKLGSYQWTDWGI